MTISFVSQDSISPPASGATTFTIPTLTAGQLMVFIGFGSLISAPSGWNTYAPGNSYVIGTKAYASSDAGTVISFDAIASNYGFVAGFVVYASSIGSFVIGSMVTTATSSTGGLQAMTAGDVIVAACENENIGFPPDLASPYIIRNSSASGSTGTWLGFGDTIGTSLSLTANTVLGAGGAQGTSTFAMLIREASAPNAPSLTSPGNGSYIDATTNPSFTANNNSTDSANINARAMRLKASGATSYNYFDVSTGALQSTIIWNAVNYAPGTAGTFGPISGLSNGITDNWSMADQEALANLQGPFASDFTVNMQAGPSLSINAPAGSVTTSNAPSLSYNATPASGAQVTGGQWLIYTLAATQVSGFTIDIATATIPAGAVSNVTFTGNPLTVAIQSGVSLTNSTTYVAYAAITETGGIWSFTISATFTISLDQPATPTITAVASTDPVTGCPLIQLAVQGHDNILSADDASFEGSIGTWTAGANWTCAQSTTYALDGSHSLECSRINTTPGNGYVIGGFYPASPSASYTAMAAVYCDSTSEGKQWNLKVTDQGAGTWVQTFTSQAGWNYFIMPLTTEATSDSLRLFVTDDPQSAPASGQNIWLDECGIFPGTITTWTRGGLAGSTQAIVTRSDGVQVRNASIANPLSIPSPSQLVTINDYEVFPTISYTYTAQIQDVLSSTATITSPVSAPTTPAVTISTTSWWLFDPTDPSTAVSANPTQWQPVNTEQSAAHMVTGQQTLLIVANEMMHQDFNATFEIFNSNTYSLLQALLKSQKTIFISSPFGAEDTGYFRIGPQTGGMSSGMGNKTKNTTLLASTSAAPHRTIQITAVAQNRPNV